MADIEEILREPSIWNDDAHMFKPERHRTASPDMKGAQKLIFGHGPLRCVAALWAPDAAAIISATIMEECEKSGWIVVKGDKIGGRTGWEGWRLIRSQ
jgi:cytochrome P450